MKEDLYFHSDSIENLKKQVAEFLEKNKEITTAQCKEMTGASRKYTIPLFEYFDRIRLTVRIGDNRILRNG